MIEPVLEYVGSVVRWRFGIYGDNHLWTSTEFVLEVGGDVQELTLVPRAAMGDDKASIGADGLSEVAELISGSAVQPLAHEMWREAWNLRLANPRSNLVMGVAAAEIGLKQLIVELAPHAETLVEHLPAPPLETLIRKVLPSLPSRSGSVADCPQHLRKAIIQAVEARNRVVHRGAMPQLELHSTLLSLRDFLYLLDLYAGNAWAEALLSQGTRDALTP